MERGGKLYRESLVTSIKDQVANKQNTFLLSYTRLSAAKMNNLRKNLRNNDAEVFVSRNRLAQIALKEVEQEKLADLITGQTAFVWSDGDAVNISKTLMKFAKECEGFTVAGGLVEGNILEKADIQRMSDLPSREVLLSQLLATIVAPVTRFAGLLNAKTRDLLSILNQLSEKKKEGGN